jgi:hypothetical protein
VLKVLFVVTVAAWVVTSDQWLGRAVLVGLALAVTGVVRWVRR